MKRFRAMRHCRVLVAALMIGAPALVGPASGPARAAEAFVAGVEDLPLMPGLAMVQGAGVAFDSPQGRIVDVYADGKASREEVVRFYAATLPQLGWVRSGPSEYRREGERLRIEISRKAGKIVVRFYLAPS